MQYKEAGADLELALRYCHKDARRNKRRILINLIPLKIRLGKVQCHIRASSKLFMCGSALADASQFTRMPQPCLSGLGRVPRQPLDCVSCSPSYVGRILTVS